MKKRTKEIICFILAMIFFVFSMYFSCGDRISSEISIRYSEVKYKKSNDIVDLLNLCYYLNNSNRKSDRAKEVDYLKELLDTKQINENIDKSKLKEAYEISELCSAQDWITVAYLCDLLTLKMFDQYTMEFQNYFSGIGEEMKPLCVRAICGVYEVDSDYNVLKTGVNAYRQLAEHTDDFILKNNCLIAVEAINDGLLDQGIIKEPI